MLLLIAPAAVILLLFQVLPIVIGANASFRDWALYDPKKTWVGLAHYAAVLTDHAFLTVVLPNTFVNTPNKLWHHNAEPRVAAVDGPYC